MTEEERRALRRKNYKRQQAGWVDIDKMQRQVDATRAEAERAVSGQKAQASMRRALGIGSNYRESSKDVIKDAFTKESAKSAKVPVSSVIRGVGTYSAPKSSGTKASETTKKKGTWNKEEAMRQRREAAKAAGKGNWNAQDEMRKRREAAQAKKANASTTSTKKKSTWNAEEEMRKRREAARAAGKGTWNAEEEMRKRREAARAKKGK